MSVEKPTSPAASRAARRLSRVPISRRRLVADRLDVLITALDPAGPKARTTSERFRRLEELVTAHDHSALWLALAVLQAGLPNEEQFLAARRAATLDGVIAGLSRPLALSGTLRFLPVLRPLLVEVVRDAIVVDVGHTAGVQFATGIQRVVREFVRRIPAEAAPVFVGWTEDRRVFRRLTPAEAVSVGRAPGDGRDPDRVALIPWGGRYVLPELNLERESLRRLGALAAYSNTSTAAIGYDTVPISSSETTAFLVSGRFAGFLSAVKFFDVVVPISVAAGVEFSGWCRMLVGSGVSGPVVRVVELGSDVPGVVSVGDEGVVEWLLRGLVGPLVVCVGSHEPRKNHGAVLQAAEVLWREGLVFSLVFVGGNSWGSAGFAARVEQLRGAGRGVRVVSGVSDGVLWGLYRRAAFSVFPSLNEGFGLPLVESLAVGTPVVTSGFGSMREIVESGGGGVFVDPRDDGDVARGMRLLLTDAGLLERLGGEALARPVRGWDAYAAETWTAMTA